jgi:hypothetical protein
MQESMKSILRKLCLLAVAAAISSASVQPGAALAQTSGMGSDGNTRFLWRAANNEISLWDADANLSAFASIVYGPYAGWTPVAMTAGLNNYTYVLWTYANGAVGIWLVDPNLNFVNIAVYGPYLGWTGESLSTGTSSTNLRLLWKRTDGMLAIYSLDQNLNFLKGALYGPYFGWNPAPVGQALRKEPAAAQTAAARQMPAVARAHAEAVLHAGRAMQQHTSTAKKALALPKA